MAWYYTWKSLHTSPENYFVVQPLSHVQLAATPWTASNTRPPCPSPSPRACSNSCPLSQWWHPTIFLSTVPFSSCLRVFSNVESQLSTSGGQNTGASASALVLPIKIQGWFSLGLTALILQSKGLSRVFSNTTVQKYQFFGTQLSSQSNSHIHTWLLEKP